MIKVSTNQYRISQWPRLAATCLLVGTAGCRQHADSQRQSVSALCATYGPGQHARAAQLGIWAPSMELSRSLSLTVGAGEAGPQHVRRSLEAAAAAQGSADAPRLLLGVFLTSSAYGPPLANVDAVAATLLLETPEGRAALATAADSAARLPLEPGGSGVRLWLSSVGPLTMLDRSELADISSGVRRLFCASWSAMSRAPSSRVDTSLALHDSLAALIAQRRALEVLLRTGRPDDSVFVRSATRVLGLELGME